MSIRPSVRSVLAAAVIAVGLSFAAAMAANEEETATALATKVGGLVKQLDSPRLADRDAAEKALVALGPEALDVLPRGESKLSAEVKQRLTRVRRQLEVAFSKSAAKASLITLADGEYRLSAVLAALTKQSGNPLVDGRAKGANGEPPADPQIRVGFDKTPFWQALDTTLDAAGVALDIRDAHADVPLQLVVVDRGPAENSRSKAALYRGPLRFAIVDSDVKRDPDDSTGLLRVVMEAAWEPRLKPIALNLAARDVAAVDDKQRTLGAVSQDAQWATSSLGGQGAVRFTLPFMLPDSDANSVSLKGRISALLAGAHVAFRFERLGEIRSGSTTTSQATTSQKMGDATVRLESFRRVSDKWIARFRVVYDNPQEAVQSHYDWLYASRAAIADGDARREPIDFDATAAEDGVMGTYIFNAKDTDKASEITLVYTTPAVIMTVPFEFEFDRVAIPMK
jgi:hypothetical protein